LSTSPFRTPPGKPKVSRDDHDGDAGIVDIMERRKDGLTMRGQPKLSVGEGQLQLTWGF
jgi:hypothetical protein